MCECAEGKGGKGGGRKGGGGKGSGEGGKRVGVGRRCLSVVIMRALFN